VLGVDGEKIINELHDQPLLPLGSPLLPKVARSWEDDALTDDHLRPIPTLLTRKSPELVIDLVAVKAVQCVCYPADPVRLAACVICCPAPYPDLVGHRNPFRLRFMVSNTQRKNPNAATSRFFLYSIATSRE